MRVSVIIETVNVEEPPFLRLEAVLEALRGQAGPLEILVVVDQTRRELAGWLHHDQPDVSCIETSDPTYFGMKNLGARHASGDILAFLDSDTIPTPQWASAFAERIRTGAHAVAGKTRYERSQRMAKTFDFFNFGFVQRQPDGTASNCLPNNLAVRADVFRDHPFDARIRRSGAGNLLCQQLKSLGYSFVYEPRQEVAHQSYGVAEEMRMRVKAGYDVVNLAQHDDRAVLHETRFLRTGLAGLLAVFGSRLLCDVRALARNRADLGLTLADVPYFAVASPVIRSLEFGAACLTLLRPAYLRDKFGW